MSLTWVLCMLTLPITSVECYSSLFFWSALHVLLLFLSCFLFLSSASPKKQPKFVLNASTLASMCFSLLISTFNLLLQKLKMNSFTWKKPFLWLGGACVSVLTLSSFQNWLWFVFVVETLGLKTYEIYELLIYRKLSRKTLWLLLFTPFPFFRGSSTWKFEELYVCSLTFLFSFFGPNNHEAPYSWNYLRFVGCELAMQVQNAKGEILVTITTLLMNMHMF